MKLIWNYGRPVVYIEAPQAKPTDALADSVTVKAGIVAVKQWMAEGKG